MTKQNFFITKLSNKQKRERLVFFAKKQIGKLFKWGIKDSEIGKYFDCSSLTQYLYKKIGIDLPRSTILQAYHGKTIKTASKSPFFKKTDLKTGDLIFFKSEKGHFTPKFPNGIGHIIMYLGNGKFIHADSHGQVPIYNVGLNTSGIIMKGENQGVKLENFQKISNRKDFVIAKRILKD